MNKSNRIVCYAAIRKTVMLWTAWRKENEQDLPDYLEQGKEQLGRGI